MKTQKRGVGRPMAKITIPNKKFTFGDLKVANEAVTPLTLRKFLARDAAKNGKSQVVKTKESVAPADGIGRRLFVYISRSRFNGIKNARKAAKSKVSVNLTDSPAPAAVNTPGAPVAA